MSTVVQISIIAIVVAICACVIRAQAGSVSVVLSIAGCVLILLLSLQFLKPVITVLQRLETLSGLSGAATAPMLKVAGIGLLTQIAGTICDDAGEKALCKAVEIGGAVLSFYISMPLLTAVLDLLEEMLG